MSVDPIPQIRLDEYVSGLARTRGWAVEILWLIVASVAFSSWIPGSGWRVAALRLFGARVGRGVVIKPGVRVKYPWRLVVGDHVWIGEDTWIDNLETVTIGSHCCLSQAVYLCTGNHDWSDPRFALIAAAIVIEDGSWIAARATVGPGVRVGRRAVLTLGSVALSDLPAARICRGVPAVPHGIRRVRRIRPASHTRNTSGLQSSFALRTESGPWPSQSSKVGGPAVSA